MVIGHLTIRSRLSKMIPDGRIPHAMLFVGADGYGTLALALDFARLAVCSNPRTVAAADSGAHAAFTEACGVCRSCVQTSTLQHPDVTILTALPTGKFDSEQDLPDDVLEELSAQLRTIAQDPYEPFGLRNAMQIRISQIRNLKRSLSLSSVQAGKRIVIVHHADEMNTEASNAFLKTLEEPHLDVTIILTTQNPVRILPTISSRCQELFVPPLAEADVTDYLVNHHDCPIEEARVVARFADGDIIRARSFLTEDMNAERTEALNLLRAALKGQKYRVALADAIQLSTEVKDQKRILRLLQFLALWIRDTQLVESSGTVDIVANIDQTEALQKFSASFGTADLALCLTSVERASRDIRRNVSPSLVLLTTLVDIRRILYTTRQTAAV
ncbi:MAG: hypothetical protein HYX66_05905 [Ignavibacteria bacterium]|nr:hypothetical protein [Ignavibacteria bacterium]